jgi:hypothetical protein
MPERVILWSDEDGESHLSINLSREIHLTVDLDDTEFEDLYQAFANEKTSRECEVPKKVED